MKTIGIFSPLRSKGLRRTLDALGEVFDVCFEERSDGNDDGIDSWFFHEADWKTFRGTVYGDCPSYAVISDDQRVPCGESSTIEFSKNAALSPLLSGRQIRTDEAIKLMALPQQVENMTVLASKGGAPVWAMREVQGHSHHYVSLSVPELNEGEPLFQYFDGKNFLQLLPLILFLRRLTEDQHWEQPPLRACFMFDDPNLHWGTYGFIDFAKIAAHAQMHNYHACFAIIPQDTWFVHMPTALLFQQYRNQLSLLIHGNDHIADELARPYPDEERNRNLRQALRRIGAFERRSGVEVSKVMAPPHGACSEITLAEMAHLGFEAACISRGSLRRYNGRANWLRTLGMKPSDIIAGLTVFPRFRISRTCHDSILIAALLDQPIIPVGHHCDLADGIKLLDDLAGFVNSLGAVHWADMKAISRSHYARRVEDKFLRVRMFTKRIEVCVPEGISQVLVERPWLKGTETMPLTWQHLTDDSKWHLCHGDEAIPVLPGQKIEISAEPPASSFIDTSVRKLNLWPVVRRQLTEARDRLAPVLRRVSTLSIKPNKAKQ